MNLARTVTPGKSTNTVTCGVIAKLRCRNQPFTIYQKGPEDLKSVSTLMQVKRTAPRKYPTHIQFNDQRCFNALWTNKTKSLGCGPQTKTRMNFFLNQQDGKKLRRSKGFAQNMTPNYSNLWRTAVRFQARQNSASC